jgi:hypothetical protein
MPTETFVNYWIGEEPVPPSPPLSAMPAYVPVVPLAFVTITDDFQLDFTFLTKQNRISTIQGWIKEVRANGSKVLFSINDQKLGHVPRINLFAEMVAQNALEWGVDGVDLDYEGWDTPDEIVIAVTQALKRAWRDKLGSDPFLSAPIYSPWAGHPDFLKSFAAELDLVTTMDYTPYPGFDGTIELFGQYADAIGSPEKLAIGVSCMEPGTGNFTPLEDVEKFCKWEPEGGRKGGVMLYTFSYDVEARGTGYPDGTWTKTIEANLP